MRRILDLFCGVGGATEGYQRAGFQATGVDIAAQPDYRGWEFWGCDALTALSHPQEIRGRFDAIHASPPCQAYTALELGTNAARGNDHPRLYAPVRAMLDDIGLPYVIENPAARPDVVLCGEMFGLGVLRHRRFELGGWRMAQPAHQLHRGRVRGWRHGEYFDGPYVAVYGNGGGKASVPEMQEAMDIHWTNSRHGITEAVPPAYTEHIGAALARHLAGAL